jgi:hypothetical protein
MTTLKISNKEACSGSFSMKLRKIIELSKGGKLEAVDENGENFIMQKGTFNPVQVQNNDDVIDIEVPLNDDKVVAPTYQFKSNNKFDEAESKYGFVPSAHLALQCNPVGLWYMYQQTGKYRSQFVDYSELDKSSDNMALNHIEAITKLMTKRTVYQMILQEMPEIGTDINGKTIKLKIAGYNASKIGLLALKDNEHVLAIIYDAAEDKAQGISGDKKNVDARIAKKLAD